MKRHQLEHVVRAAAAIVDDEIVVIGSQAVVMQADDPPEPLVLSMEADVYPLREHGKAIEIDGVIGDGSSFHDQNGYYAHGVGPETPHAPAGWEARAVRQVFPPTAGWKTEAIGHFMELHDVVLSKLVAGRAKDLEYTRAAVEAELVDVDNLRRGIDLMTPDDAAVAQRNLDRALAGAS